MSLIEIDFSDDELDGLFNSAPQADENSPEPTDELVGLTRKLASQYVDVLATFARDSFRGTADIDTHGVSGAVDALARLAESTGDVDLLRVLQQLAKLVDAVGDTERTNPRVRDLLRVQMRHWVLRFADCLEGAERKRMRDLVLFDRSNVPLFDQLSRIKGIGPRRIQRMYCAGLFTIDTVVRSSPEDISSVTGIPIALARRIHEETSNYATEMKGDAITALVDALGQFRRVFPRFERSDSTSLQQVRLMLIELQNTIETSPLGGTQ